MYPLHGRPISAVAQFCGPGPQVLRCFTFLCLTSDLVVTLVHYPHSLLITARQDLAVVLPN